MITKELLYVASCDGKGCDINFEWDDGYFVTHLKSDMKDMLMDHEWTIKGNKCYCPKCSKKHARAK